MPEAVAFFAVGGLAFYALVTVAIIAMCVALEQNSWVASLVILGVFLGVIGVWGDGVAAAKWAYHNPMYIGAALAGYIVIAAGWGVGRWWLEMRKLSRNYKEVYVKTRKDFLKENQDKVDEPISDKTPVPEVLREKWKKQRIYFRHWKLSVNDNGRLDVPQASDYKPEIITWMAFWPVSLLWTILDDFVKELFENIYQATAAWMQRIADREFKGIMETQVQDNEVVEKPAAPGQDEQAVVGVTGATGPTGTGTPADLDSSGGLIRG